MPFDSKSGITENQIIALVKYGIKYECISSIGILKEQWLLLLEDKEVIKAEDIELLKQIYNSSNSMATSPQLTSLLNKKHYILVNGQIGKLGKRIAKKLKIDVPKETDNERPRYWNVPFLGISTKEGFYWILRPELKDAMTDLDGIPTEGNFILPDEVDIDNIEELYEGARKQVYVNQYERDRRARNKCIRIHGTKCSICNFDFENAYGEVGKHIIHVHHLKPLSEIKEEYMVDPENDLRPVCPNCHTIIHRRKPAYSIDEVKAMLEHAAHCEDTRSGLIK